MSYQNQVREHPFLRLTFIAAYTYNRKHFQQMMKRLVYYYVDQVVIYKILILPVILLFYLQVDTSLWGGNMRKYGSRNK